MASTTTTAATGNDALGNSDAGEFTVKVRRADDLRRFGFSGTSFASLEGLIRRLFAIEAQVPVSLKYRDDENDLVTLSTDAELAEARKTSGRILHLVLSVPDAPVFKLPVAAAAAAAPQLPPAASDVTPGAPAALPAVAPAACPGRGGFHHHHGHRGRGWAHRGMVHAPHGLPHGMVHGMAIGPDGRARCAAMSAAGGDQQAQVAKWTPEWKQEKQALAARWKEERGALKEQIKALKAGNNSDKKELKEQIKLLRQQVQATKKDLQRMPKDGIMQARFVSDVTLPDGSEVAPGAKLVKTWRFRNDSAKAWPEGSVLALISKKSDKLGAPETTPVPQCQPGQEVEVSVPVVAPAQAGRYTAYFRISGPGGKKFGQRVWASITVFDSSSSSGDEKEVPAQCLAQYAGQLKVLAEMGYTDVKTNVRILRKVNGVLEKAVALLIKRQQRKGALPTF